MATYQELISRKAALEKQAAELQEQIDSAHEAERADVLKQIKSLMDQHGISMAELGSGKGSGRAPRSAAKVKSKTGGTGRKVAAKYRDSATGNAWSGRGLQPNWLKAALASGKKIEDFAV